MLYSQYRDKVIKLCNQYSQSGNLTPITDGSVQDNVLRLAQFADTAQKEIATTAKYIRKKMPISQNPIPNMLPNPLYTFDLQQYLPGNDRTDMVGKGAKSYNYETDGIGTQYIEEEYPSGTWNILKTINNTVKGQFTRFYGFTGCTDDSRNVRVRFTGLYPYNIRNRALFAYLFPTEADIPVYKKYVPYTLPDDFWQLNRVTNINGITFTNTLEFEWQDKDVIGINYFLPGETTIFYYAYPGNIDDTTPDTYKFEVDEEAAQAIPYYAASQALMDDPVNKSVSEKLYAMYQSKLANMSNTISQGSQGVRNTLFTGDDIQGSKLF